MTKTVTQYWLTGWDQKPTRVVLTYPFHWWLLYAIVEIPHTLSDTKLGERILVWLASLIPWKDDGGGWTNVGSYFGNPICFAWLYALDITQRLESHVLTRQEQQVRWLDVPDKELDWMASSIGQSHIWKLQDKEEGR